MSVRRRKPETPPVPERLARFVRSEWSAALSCEQAVEVWHRARSAWAREHQYEFMGYTTSPLGDWLDLLRAEREAWLLNCCTTEPDDANGHRDW